MHDFFALFDHRRLIFARRYGVRAECGDIRRLRNGIRQKAHGNARLEITQLNFRFHRRVALQSGKRDEIHIVKGKFRKLRHFGLNKNRGFLGIYSAREIIERHFDHVRPHFFGVFRIIRQRLRVGDHNINFVVFSRILQTHSFA